MKFRGANCITDCGGHRAGFRYAERGGRKRAKRSPSFNRGMRIGIKAVKARRSRKR